MAKCEAAAKSISEEAGVPSSLLVPMKMDLDSLQSVEEFSAAILAKETRLDALVLNAGIAEVGEMSMTQDGIEKGDRLPHPANKHVVP